jgi:hypothetical protein
VTEEAKHLDDGVVRKAFSFATMELNGPDTPLLPGEQSPKASPYGQLDDRIVDW